MRKPTVLGRDGESAGRGGLSIKRNKFSPGLARVQLSLGVQGPLSRLGIGVTYTTGVDLDPLAD